MLHSEILTRVAGESVNQCRDVAIPSLDLYPILYYTRNTGRLHLSEVIVFDCRYGARQWRHHMDYLNWRFILSEPTFLNSPLDI